MSAADFILDALAGAAIVPFVIWFLTKVELLPVIFRVPRSWIGGVHGRNWPGLVLIANDLKGWDRIGTTEQEKTEAIIKSDPFALIRILTRDDAKRELELKGHAAEIKAHPAADRDRILQRETDTLARPGAYGGIFDGWTRERIERELRARL